MKLGLGRTAEWVHRALRWSLKAFLGSECVLGAAQCGTHVLGTSIIHKQQCYIF